MIGMEYIEIQGQKVVSAMAKEINLCFLNILSRPFEKCHSVFFLNAHCANLRFNNNDYRTAIDDAFLVLNDGLGVDIAAWRQGKKFKENLNGSDLIDEGEFLKLCAKKGFTVFILGGKPEVLDKAIVNYSANYPNLKIVGNHHGYFDTEEDINVVDRINKSQADILLVCFGCPKQELWIHKYKKLLKVKLAFGLGGSIDQVAKVIPRAPRIFIKTRFEWFYRLCQEPRRLFWRYTIGNIIFLWRVLLNRRPNNRQ